MIDAKIDDQAVVNVLGKIGRLETRFAKNAMRRALRKGAAPIRDRARMYARQIDDPKTPEQIWKNIVIRGGRTRDKNLLKVRVGVLGGARDLTAHGEFKGGGKANPGGDTFYWRFLEFGTRKMKARPFMRPAMHEKKDEVLRDMIKYLQDELAKEVKKRL